MYKFTVIINTYPHLHREVDLLRNISSLKKQTFNSFKILFVENGENTKELSRIIKRSKLFKDKYSIITNPHKRLSLLFNIGWKNSKTDYLAFLADDAEAHKDWLKNIDLELKNKTIGVVTGPIITTQKVSGEMHRLYLITRKNFLFRLLSWPYMYFTMENNVLKPGYLFESGAYSIGAGLKSSLHYERQDIDLATTSSMGIRKSILEKVNGFDERFYFNHADGDLFVRIKKAGFRIVFDPKIIAYHHLRIGPSRNAYFIGIDTGRFYRKHVRPRSYRGLLGFTLNIVVFNAFWIYSCATNRDIRQLRGITGWLKGLTS